MNPNTTPILATVTFVLLACCSATNSIISTSEQRPFTHHVSDVGTSASESSITNRSITNHYALDTTHTAAGCLLPSVFDPNVVPQSYANHGCVLGENLPSGYSCNVKCDIGYFGCGTTKYVCTDGQLTDPTLTCSSATCTVPDSFGPDIIPATNYGCTTGEMLPSDCYCNVQCDTGYVGSGTREYQCSTNAQLTDPTLTCTSSTAGCLLPSSFGPHVVPQSYANDGCVLAETLPSDYGCNVQCDTGYVGSGTTQYHCSTDAQLTDATLTCTSSAQNPSPSPHSDPDPYGNPSDGCASIETDQCIVTDNEDQCLDDMCSASCEYNSDCPLFGNSAVGECLTNLNLDGNPDGKCVPRCTTDSDCTYYGDGSAYCDTECYLDGRTTSGWAGCCVYTHSSPPPSSGPMCYSPIILAGYNCWVEYVGFVLGGLIVAAVGYNFCKCIQHKEPKEMYFTDEAEDSDEQICEPLIEPLLNPTNSTSSSDVLPLSEAKMDIEEQPAVATLAAAKDTVRRPLQCAAICFLVLSLLEASGIFSMGVLIIITEWNATISPSNSSSTGNRTGAAAAAVGIDFIFQTTNLPQTYVNQSCSNAIMAMYASFCFGMFSIQSIRKESKIQLASACIFSVLFALFVTLHLQNNQFGHVWMKIRLPALITSFLCSVIFLFLANPVSTTFGSIKLEILKNRDDMTRKVYERYSNWSDAASVDFAIWVLVILAGGAFVSWIVVPQC